MSLTDQLSRLSARAKQAEDHVAAARTQARDRLEQLDADAATAGLS
jgi:hypothetical protein